MTGSCAHTETAAPARPKPAQLVVGSEAVATGTMGLAAWMAYGNKRAQLIKERTGHFHNRSGDDYTLEIASRQAMVEVWAKSRTFNETPNPYLDLMLELSTAGYLEEYVVVFFAKPGWTIPGAALSLLNIPEFTQWSAQKLAGHQPQTLVQAKPADAPEAPQVPGRGSSARH
jgi:hypothetical protein